MASTIRIFLVGLIALFFTSFGISQTRSILYRSSTGTVDMTTIESIISEAQTGVVKSITMPTGFSVAPVNGSGAVTITLSGLTANQFLKVNGTNNGVVSSALTIADVSGLQAAIDGKQASLTFPLSYAQGGTNATTAQAALNNLAGVTGTGDNGKVLSVVSGNLTLTTLSPAGINSLNGLTALTQTFAVTTSGSAAAAFTSATSTHTLNIPILSSGSANTAPSLWTNTSKTIAGDITQQDGITVQGFTKISGRFVKTKAATYTGTTATINPNIPKHLFNLTANCTATIQSGAEVDTEVIIETEETSNGDIILTAGAGETIEGAASRTITAACKGISNKIVKRTATNWVLFSHL